MQILTKNIATMKSEVARHIAADAVIQNSYWNAVTGKGCFIGCLTQSPYANAVTELYGLSEQMVRICERIFERLPIEAAKEFFAEVPKAIGLDGKDTSLLHWKFLGDTLRALPPQPAEIQAVIDPVIVGMYLLASGQDWPDAARAADAADAAADAADAADAAADAADAAAYAARAAYAAAYAARAARAAEDAARAVDHAARAAEDAARAARAAYAARAASAAEIIRQRDSVLALFRAA
jgi:hypothetical protein